MKAMQGNLYVRGITFKPNFFYTKSHSEILPQGSNEVRKGQVRNDYTFGFGVIGSFPDFFTRKVSGTRKQESPEPEKQGEKAVQKKDSIVVQEEDENLVE